MVFTPSQLMFFALFCPCFDPCQSLVEPARACQSLQHGRAYPVPFQSLAEPCRACSMAEPVRACQSLSEPARACRALQQGRACSIQHYLLPVFVNVCHRFQFTFNLSIFCASIRVFSFHNVRNPQLFFLIPNHAQRLGRLLGTLKRF